MEDQKEAIRILTDCLNRTKTEPQNTAILSQQEYDILLNELKQMEDETGFSCVDSPTEQVKWISKDRLPLGLNRLLQTTFHKTVAFSGNLNPYSHEQLRTLLCQNGATFTRNLKNADLVIVGTDCGRTVYDASRYHIPVLPIRLYI